MTEWMRPRELPNLDGVELIAIDTEENDEGLRADRGSGWPWRGGYVCGISLAWHGAPGEIARIYIPMRHPDTANFEPAQVYGWLKDLIAAGVRFTTKNGNYDWGWLRTDGGVLMPDSSCIEEIGAAATLIDENHRDYSLEAMCERARLPGKDTALLYEGLTALGIKPKGKQKLNPREHLWKMPARFVGPYAEIDAVRTLQLHEIYTPLIEAEGARDQYRLECDLMPMTLEMRRRGGRVDQDAAEQARDLLLGKRDTVLAEISSRLGAAVSMTELNSSKWKIKIFGEENIPIPNVTEKGAPSFAGGGGEKGWMTTNKHWLPPLMTVASKYHGAATKFLEGHILEHIVGGRIYAQINSFKSEDGGTKSLRFSYSDPPLQQMPHRDPELGPLIRSVFLPEEGEFWATTDASQQEFRKLVDLAEQHNLPGAREAGDNYRNNPKADYHRFVAEMTGLDRDTLAKPINFTLIYGGGANRIAEVTGRTRAEAETLMRQYHERLPFVAALDSQVKREARRNGYTNLEGGARRHWSLYEAVGHRGASWKQGKGNGACSLEEAARRVHDPEHPWHNMEVTRFGIYKALNALIQGSAAVHTKRWMRAAFREGIVPMLQMHDALECSVKTRDQAEMIARLGCEAVQWTVPMKIDMKFGHTWGDARHKWEEIPPAPPPPRPARPKPVPQPPPQPTPLSPIDREAAIEAAGDRVVELPHEHIAITALSPDDGVLISKSIDQSNRINSYPQVKWWKQAVARIPATMVALEHALRAVREKNICLIRGAPVNLTRKRTRRINAIVDTDGFGDHGFDDVPSRLLFLDIDRAEIAWRDDIEGAVRQVRARLEEPFASASCVWFLTAGHGLQTETVDSGRVNGKGEAITFKRWTGVTDYGVMRLRLAFICDRALDCSEADALTLIAKANGFGLDIDPCVSRCVQINYIHPMHWTAGPEHNPLRDVQSIGMIRGLRETLAVPSDLTHKARWMRAQGHGGMIASHPNADAAVRAIGSNGRIRDHLFSALWHLASANRMPVGASVGVDNHAVMLVGKLEELIEQHRSEISANLAAVGRRLDDVYGYFPKNVTDIAIWSVHKRVDGGGGGPRKTIRLSYQAPANDPAEPEKTAEEIIARVIRTIKEATKGVTLLIAPPGSWKSTTMRAEAVKYVTEHEGESVAILVPRHRLGEEQVRALHNEFPDAKFTAAIWRGRHRGDPEFIGPQQPLDPVLMCRRSEEAEKLELNLISVTKNLCEKGRGKKKIKCRFFDICGAQRQRHTVANIWFGAHELLGHETPVAFGEKIGRLFIDESPLGALVFGTDAPFTLALDKLQLVPKKDFPSRNQLMEGRRTLHEAMDPLPVPAEEWRGVSVGREHLSDFMPQKIGGDGNLAEVRMAALYPPKDMIKLEWHGMVVPPIRPDMSKEELDAQLHHASGNATVARLVELWGVLGDAGRVQIHNSDKGRMIRMVGVRRIAKGWRGIPTLIADGTGDAELLRAIWPKLKCEVEAWEQLPRPGNVRIFQVVDKALSKLMVAVDTDDEEKLKPKEAAARRLWAAVLRCALEYDGAEVGVILYKSTEDWIREHCFVPDWIKMVHHGDVTGSNELEKVRALFVIGRPLAAAEVMTRTTEALFGDYIAERGYQTRAKGGKIPIVPDKVGNNTIEVDVWKHPDPRAERARRQVTEASLIQAIGRARAGLRGADEPLDIHLWTDVPLPELGAVEPVLWGDLEVGPDGLMPAAGGVWLENAGNAAAAYPGLITVAALRKDRERHPTRFAKWRGLARGGTTSPIGYIIGIVVPPPAPVTFEYQLTGSGQKPARGLSLMGLDAARVWLEAKLGKLAFFRVIEAQDEADTVGEASEQKKEAAE